MPLRAEDLIMNTKRQKTAILSVRMYEEDKDHLTALAKKQNCTISDLVYELLGNHYLAELIDNRDRYWYGHA